MRLVKPIICIIFFGITTPALAFPDLLMAWRDKYPESTSDDIDPGVDGGCQLCHQNSGGGNGWNSYGWDVRSAYLSNSRDINIALDLVENADQDNDPVGATAFDEIELNRQPGWREGALNTIFFRNNSSLSNQLPPANLPATTDYDFPAGVQNPIASAIDAGIGAGLMEVAGGFNAPLRAVTAPGVSDKIFVVEQTGKIICVDLITGHKSTFFDVSSRLVDISPSYDERGLLGLAFHPEFQDNGLFYTYQSEPVRSDDTADFPPQPSGAIPDHRTFVVENHASDASCSAVSQALNNVLIIDQPQANHNGGDLVFDAEANLYISLGDGGSASDRGPGHGLTGNGRNKGNVLGTILRINPLGTSLGNTNYSVPADNPFVGDLSGVDEIYAYGFRNPYRMSFDAANGDLYTGDVGQNDVEEIDQVVIGGNYGWNWKEGSFFFYNPQGGNYVSDVAPPNLPADLIDPVGEYDRDEGISVTGGYVYRGSAMPNLVGKYVFGDFSGPNFGSAAGRLFYLDLQSREIKEFSICPSVPGYIFGFGQDANNELYVLTNDRFNPSGVNGKLLKIMNPAEDEELPPQCRASSDLCIPIKANNGAIAVVCL